MYGSMSSYVMFGQAKTNLSEAAYLSADPESFEKIAAICRRTGATHCLHLGADSSELSNYLAEKEIKSKSIDVNIITSRFSESADGRVAIEIDSELAPHKYLTTCINLLQSIDREHLSCVLRMLHTITKQHLVIAVRTSPSAAENLYGSTLLSMPAWSRLFELSGFKIVEILESESNAAKGEDLPGIEKELIQHWRCAGLFGTATVSSDRASESILLLEKNCENLAESAVHQKINDLLDISFRALKRKQFVFQDPRSIFFNFNVLQEWSFIRPLLDVVPRDKCHFLIRQDQSTDTRALLAIKGFLQRNSISHTTYEQISELPWQKMRGNLVMSASESTMDNALHVSSHLLTANARLQGCTTILLQHGIWPCPSPNRVISFASEKILFWGKEEVNRLRTGVHQINGQSAPWGMIDEKQICYVGSPKYSDQLLSQSTGFNTRFGFETSQFARVVLIGTKNLRSRYGAANINDEFINSLRSLFQSMPDVLFIIRPHPLTAIEDFLGLRASNVVIFDELTGILADTALSRVVPHIDLMVTSPSTLILDGTLSNKPVFVYGTGQPIIYDDIEVSTLEAVPSVVHSEPMQKKLLESGNRFKSRYGECIDENFYSRLPEILHKSDQVDVDLSTALSLTLSEEAITHHRNASRLNNEVIALREHVGRLRATAALQ
jgi:hypothetical protein